MNTLARSAFNVKSAKNVLRIFASHQKSFSVSQRHFKEEVVKNPEEPLKFFGSGAQTFKTKYTRVGSFNPDEIPWFQPYAVVGSVAIFLLYFCVLREENDIDAQLGKSLFEQVPNLEASTLISLYKYNSENSIDNTEVIIRLKELDIDPLKIQ